MWGGCGGGGRAVKLRGEEFAEGGAVRYRGGGKLDARKVGAAGALGKNVEKIIASRLHKLRAQEYIVVDVIHADRQRSHGDRDVVALKFGPGLFGGAGRQ